MCYPPPHFKLEFVEYFADRSWTMRPMHSFIEITKQSFFFWISKQILMFRKYVIMPRVKLYVPSVHTKRILWCLWFEIESGHPKINSLIVLVVRPRKSLDPILLFLQFLSVYPHFYPLSSGTRLGSDTLYLFITIGSNKNAHLVLVK